MSNKIKVASASAAVLASLILVNANLTNEVKADTKPANTSSKAQTPEEAAKANIASAQKEVDSEQANTDKAKAALDQAKKDAEKPDADYKAQNDKVDSVAKTAEQKSNALTAAQEQVKKAQDLANDADNPELVKAANDAVSELEAKTEQASQAKEAADTAASQKSKEVESLNDKVQTATNNVKDKTAAKQQADQKVAVAQEAVNGTGIADAKNAVDTYQKNVNKLTENIKHNQGVLADNQKKLETNKADLKDINSKLAEAKTASETVKTQLDKDQATLEQKKQALQNSKQSISNAADFFKALSEDTSLTKEQREDAQKAYSIVMNESTFKGFYNQDVKLPWYHPAEQLGREGDATSLANMQKALSDLDDLVKIRIEYDLKLPNVSLTATAIAMMSSDYLLTHDFGHPSQHPQNGLFWSTEENIAYNTKQMPKYMEEKNIIDKAIAENPELKKYDFLDGKLTQEKWYEASEYFANKGVEHYLSLTNPAQDSIGVANAGVYSSMDILQARYNNSIDYAHLYPSFSIEQYKNLVNSYAQKSISSNPGQSSQLQAEVEEAQAAVDQATKDYNQKLQTVKSLQAQADSFTQAVQDTQKAIDQTNSQLTQDQKDLNEQQNKLAQATQKYNDLTASQDQKVQNYNDAVASQKLAQDQLNQAQEALSQAKNDLAQAKEKLAELQIDANEKAQALQNKQQELTQAKQHVEDLKNAKAALANAQEAEKEAQQAYNAAEQNLNDAKKVLNGDLKTNKDNADAKVAAAQKAYDEANAKLTEAKAKLVQAQQKLQDILNANTAHDFIVSDQTETKPADKPADVKTTEVTQPTEVNTPSEVRLTHNAFVYNRQGKLVRKGLHIKLIKRGKSIKNAKIVTIKGKKYYQIGKNEFIKVANTKLSTHKIHVKAKIKDNKRIKMYNRSGKFNKHYASPSHTYTFNEKAKINGKTYYKIANTNNWIPAKKLALKK